MLALAKRYLQHDWNEMSFRTVVLTDLSAFMGTCRIEVAERYEFDAVRDIEPLHHFLHRQLRFTVGVRRQRTIIFIDRHVLRLAVCCCRRGEHDFSDIVFVHLLKQTKRAVHVVMIIFARVLHAFANKRVGCEMNNRINLIFFKYSVHKSRIPKIAYVQLSSKQCFAVALLQIIDDHDILAALLQGRYRMRTDIACSSSYEYRHVGYPLSISRLFAYLCSRQAVLRRCR
ncbi:hypothetical protein D3C78_1338990 [compost metagenome]